MDRTVMIALLNNTALLLVLSVIYEITYFKSLRYRRLQSVLSGLLIALIGIAIMRIPFTLQPGLIFDTRTILISTTALIFGPVPTIIAASAAFIYRILIGGSGPLSGLTTIVSSALIGLAWRRWIYPKSIKQRWLSVYVMGVIVHAVMLSCMLLLPYPDNINVIRAIAAPVMLIYPIASVLLSMLLLRQQELRHIQDQLILSEENAKKNLSRLRSLLDNSPSPIVIIDENGKFVEVSSVAEKILGLPKEEIYNKEIAQIAPPDMVKKALYVLSQSSTDGQFLENIDVFEFDGNRRYFESRLFPIHVPNNNEKLFGYLGIDVTERVMAEHALKESEEKYSSYIENAPDGVCIVNASGYFVEVNRCATEMTGYTKEQLLKMSFMDITADESLESAMHCFEELKNTGSMSAEFKFIHSNGIVRWWNIDAVKLSDEKFLGFTSDITEKKDTEANLLYMINHDSLTGLYNRLYFEEKLRQIDNQTHLPLSIIIADINGLKLINDSFGHLEGDRVIVQAAELINSCCQDRKDVILFRTGGDEFCMLLSNTDLASALQLIKSIQDTCEQYNASVSNQSLHISISLGADTKEIMADDIVQVFKKAEDLMHQRKLLEKGSSYSAIISSIKATMLEKSHETEAHSERMSHLSRIVGLMLNLSQTELDHLELLATLHDIGKVGIAERILKKPGKLDAAEWTEMKKHPEIGYRIAMSSPNLAPIANYILHHHERWDGSGYPRKIKGTEIPLISRIIAVVDAYDAMTEDRVYQKAKTHEEAIEEIRKCAGSQFDPHIAKIFIDAMCASDTQMWIG